MRKNAAKAARPKKRFVVSEQAREAMRAVVVETIDALNIPALIRAAVQSSNPPDPYIGTAQAMSPASPLSPPQPADHITKGHDVVARAMDELGKARARWYKATAELEKTSPLDPSYNNVVVEADMATHNMLGSAREFQQVVAGVSLG